MEHADELQGKVLSRVMKAALIEDMLNLWVSQKGGKWEKIDGRPGERNQEFLVGDLELPYTQQAEFGGVAHYVISFNEKALNPLSEIVSSDNAQRLTEKEITAIIDSPPKEEQLG